MKNRDFKDLLTSIEQARKIHAGRMKPGAISKFRPIMIRKIRKRLRTSQVEFAHLIGVSVDTLQNWEQGRRRPQGPALALLRVAESHPKTVMKSLHPRLA
jgi:putative transcriptional regulator